MRRVVTPELLDTDQGSPAEIEQSLRDIGRVNRWFGGTSTTAAMVERVAARTGRRELSVLDVGAGAGDLMRDVSQQVAGHGVRLQATLLDRAATHLPRNGMRSVSADALALPFSGGSFDVVASSLFVHHLEPDEIVTFLEGALRVCRLAVVINDLRRDPVHLGLVYAAFPLLRSHISRHDGVASVRRAYTREEMLGMLRQTSAASVEIETRYLYRMGAVVWK